MDRRVLNRGNELSKEIEWLRRLIIAIESGNEGEFYLETTTNKVSIPSIMHKDVMSFIESLCFSEKERLEKEFEKL